MLITVQNPTDKQRQEVVAIPLTKVQQQLQMKEGDSIIVYNKLGQQLPSQQTYDGYLLIDAYIQPLSTATYTLKKGKPQQPVISAFGAFYKERADDITWENDRSIYRVYGPALQRAGEKAYGVDIWVKNTPEIVAPERYRKHLWGMSQRNKLRREGKKVEGDSIGLASSFHHDHGRGHDCYAVGPTLGCGAPALMKSDGTLLMPYCYQEYRILDNGPLRFTVELTYGTNADGVTEHRLISLDKGSHFNRCTVWYDGIQQPTTLAMGVVLHGKDHVVLGPDYVQYADPTENAQVHQSQIYVAALFPNGVSETKNTCGHALGILHNYRGEKYTYYFGSGWSLYDVPTQEHWQLCIDDYLQNIKNPFIVQIP